MSLTLTPGAIVGNLREEDFRRYDMGRAYGLMLKAAERPVAAPVLSGRLVVSNSGWLLLTVPNALVRGLFDAMDEPGIELPLKDGRLTAHISVMRKEEVEKLGGPDKISERGHFFSYQLGPVKSVEPKGWPEMSRVWFVEVQSPALKALRKSYGLAPLPNGDHEFHITICVRRRHVLRANDVSKAAGAGGPEESEAEDSRHGGQDSRLFDAGSGASGPLPAFLAQLRDEAPVEPPGGLGAVAEGGLNSKRADFESEHGTGGPLRDDYANRDYFRRLFLSRVADEGNQGQSLDLPDRRGESSAVHAGGAADPGLSRLRADRNDDGGRDRLRIGAADVGRPAGAGLRDLDRSGTAAEYDPKVRTGERKLVERVIDDIPGEDMVGAWWHRLDGKVRVSLGDWSETPSREVHEKLERILGDARVEVDAEIGAPAGPDWEKLAGPKTSRGRLMALIVDPDYFKDRPGLPDTPKVVAEIRRAIRGLPPLMPGYGDVYYNPEERKVYVVCGDSDEREVIDSWRRRLTVIDGVDAYDGESEHVRPEVGTLRAAKPPWIKVAGLKAREPRQEAKVFTAAIDLDGTIYAYDTWKGEDHFGKLRPGVLKALREFQRRGWRIIIFTTRGNTTRVKQQLNADDVPFDYINENPDQPDGTSCKVIADVYIDDRAVDASMSWERVVDAVDRKFRKAAAAPPPALIDAIVAEELKRDAAVPLPPRKLMPPVPLARSPLFDPSPEVFNDATMNALVHEQMLPDGDPFPLPEVSDAEKAAALLANNAAMVTALLPSRIPAPRLAPARRRPNRRPAADLLTAQQEAANVDALIPMLRARRARPGLLLKQALDPVATGALIGAGVGGLGGYMLGRKTKHPWMATLAGAGVGGLYGAALSPATEVTTETHGPGSLGHAPMSPSPTRPPPSRPVAPAIPVPDLAPASLPMFGPQTLGQNIARWYSRAPGGFRAAVARAIAARKNLPGIELGFDQRDIDRPVPVEPFIPQRSAAGLRQGITEVQPRSRLQTWLGTPKDIRIKLNPDVDKFQQLKEHELTHAALQDAPEEHTGRVDPTGLDTGDTKGWSGYVTTNSELIPRVATIKRQFVAAHPGRDVNTPQDASEALDWWMKYLRTPESHRLVADTERESWNTWANEREGDTDFWAKILQLMPQLVMGNGQADTAKMAAVDFAPGLPRKDAYGDLSKLTPGQLLTYVLQHHRAHRAGPHHDIRIGSPELGLYSWAVPRGLPPPGGKNLAIHQPVHRHRYRKFEGEIPRGQYGAGTVKKVDEGQVLITKAGPDHIHFTLAHKRHPERYTLLRPRSFGRSRDWLLVNTTPAEKVPFEKLHYRRVPSDRIEDAIRQMGAGSSVEAKVDGASQLVHLLKGHAEHFSYRTSKETNRPIFHTERVFGGRPEIKYPPHLEGSILKGELHAGPISSRPNDRRHAGVGPGTGVGDAGHRSGAFGPQDIATLLNSSIGRSLQLQREQGVKVRNMLYDVRRYGRRPIGPDVPRAERREMLGEFMKHLPADTFHLSEPVHTPAEGIEMLHQIRSGKHPLTQEGVVIHPAQGMPLKGKFTDEHLVHVTGTFPGEGKRSRTVGGFTYGHEPGRTVGRVGSGFSDKFLDEVARDPAAFTGRLARVKAQEKLPSGALRAPVFLGLHEDYNAAPVKAAGTAASRARVLSTIRPGAQPSWVQHVMAHYDSTKPPPGIFTRGADEIVAAGRDPHVAPLGLGSWQKMVIFHRNRGGNRLGEERRDVLQTAIRRLSDEIREGREKAGGLLPSVQLQPQQRRVAERVNAYDPRVLVYHGLGSGKSLASIAAAERSGRPYVAAVPAALRPNYHKELAKFTDLHTPSSVLSYTQVGQGKQPSVSPDTLILDECLPAGTMIDGKPIEDWRVGSQILSFNHRTGAVEWRTIARTASRFTDSISVVRFASGRSLVCTPNHPFYTSRGYIAADSLLEGDNVYTIYGDVVPFEQGENYAALDRGNMRDVREAVLGIQVAVQDGETLLRNVPEADLVGQHEGHERRDSRCPDCKDDQQQSNGQCSVPRTRGGDIAKIGTQASDPRWQRHRADETGDAPGRGARVVAECRGIDQIGATSTLQGRRRESGIEDRHRGRRRVPPAPGEAGGRCEEDGILAVDRVVSVSFHQRGCGPEFERLCPGGVVYDLTVDMNHNFFAAGYLVHNSQRLRNPDSAATRGVMDLAARARRVLMLSGTPIVNNPSDLAVPLSILTGTPVTTREFNKRFVGKQEVSPGFLGRLRGIRPATVPTIAHEQELEDLLRGHVDYQPSRMPEGVRTNEERVVVDMSPPQKDFYRLMWNQLPWTTRWKMRHDYPMTAEELKNLQAFMTGPRQAALSLYPFRADGDALRAFHDSTKLKRAFDDVRTALGKDPRAKVIAYSNFIDAGLTPYAAALKAHGIPYSILHGKLNDAERKAQLDAYNQGKSRVLLIGPSAAEGISAQGTQLIQLLDPHWNEARMGQARGRGLRFDSHEGLPEELRNVAIRRYVARMPDPGFFGRLFGGGPRPTADEFLEAQARRKEDLNEQFRAVLRRVGSEPPTRPWWRVFS